LVAAFLSSAVLAWLKHHIKKLRFLKCEFESVDVLQASADAGGMLEDIK
jgi:hypothetical protein